MRLTWCTPDCRRKFSTSRFSDNVSTKYVEGVRPVGAELLLRCMSDRLPEVGGMYSRRRGAGKSVSL